MLEYVSTMRYEALPLTEENRETIESWGVVVSDDPMVSAWGMVYVRECASGMVCAVMSVADFAERYEVAPEVEPDPTPEPVEEPDPVAVPIPEPDPEPLPEDE